MYSCKRKSFGAYLERNKLLASETAVVITSTNGEFHYIKESAAELACLHHLIFFSTQPEWEYMVRPRIRRRRRRRRRNI